MTLDFSLTKSYFPWQSSSLLEWKKMSYPKLSVIVPSYNQGLFIEETLLSIINQNYPNLELIVIDGGSTDNSVEVILKYTQYISYWVSEKDNGQSHAINKGLDRATGEWVAWMNSDDCYLEGGLHYVFNFLPFSESDFLYGNCKVGKTLLESVAHFHPAKAKKDLASILLFFYHVSHIVPSQSVFIRRSILSNVGYVDERLDYCMDFEWFCRIYLHTNRRLFYEHPICFFRIDNHTKSANNYAKMLAEAKQITRLYLEHLERVEKFGILRKLEYSDVLASLAEHKKPFLSNLIKLCLFFPDICIADVKVRILIRNWLR